MSAASTPRTSAKVQRPTARPPGFRKLGCPTQLPLKWLPDRVRADVLTLSEWIRTNPMAGMLAVLFVCASLSLTAMTLGGNADPDAGQLQVALELTSDNPQNTKQ